MARLALSLVFKLIKFSGLGLVFIGFANDTIAQMPPYIVCKYTKFEDASFSRSKDISWGVKF